MGTVNPTQSNPGETIEAADINTPVNQLAAVVNGGIETVNLADNAVSTVKLADNAVTGAKLSTSAIKLGYAEITSSFTTTTVGSYVDVTSLSSAVTVPAGGRDVKLTVDTSIKSTAGAGTSLAVAVTEGSTVLGVKLFNSPVSAYNVPVTLVARVSAPSAGAHTYKVQCYQSSAGTLSISAGDKTAGNFGVSSLIVELM